MTNLQGAIYIVSVIWSCVTNKTYCMHYGLDYGIVNDSAYVKHTDKPTLHVDQELITYV